MNDTMQRGSPQAKQKKKKFNTSLRGVLSPPPKKMNQSVEKILPGNDQEKRKNWFNKTPNKGHSNTYGNLTESKKKWKDHDVQEATDAELKVAPIGEALSNTKKNKRKRKLSDTVASVKVSESLEEPSQSPKKKKKKAFGLFPASSFEPSESQAESTQNSNSSKRKRKKKKGTVEVPENTPGTVTESFSVDNKSGSAKKKKKKPVPPQDKSVEDSSTLSKKQKYLTEEPENNDGQLDESATINKGSKKKNRGKGKKKKGPSSNIEEESLKSGKVKKQLDDDAETSSEQEELGGVVLKREMKKEIWKELSKHPELLLKSLKSFRKPKTKKQIEECTTLGSRLTKLMKKSQKKAAKEIPGLNEEPELLKYEMSTYDDEDDMEEGMPVPGSTDTDGESSDEDEQGDADQTSIRKNTVVSGEDDSDKEEEDDDDEEKLVIDEAEESGEEEDDDEEKLVIDEDEESEEEEDLNEKDKGENEISDEDEESGEEEDLNEKDKGENEVSDEDEIESEEEKEDKKEPKVKIVDSPEKIARTIFVGNIPLTMTQKSLKNVFKPYGKVESIRFRGAIGEKLSVPKKVADIKHKFHEGLDSLKGYIVFESKEDATKALSLNGQVVDGNHIRVDRARPQNSSNNHTVFIGNLPFNIKDEDVWSKFGECCQVSSVRIIRDRNTGVGKGFGFVQFKDKASVTAAMGLNETEIGGRAIRVKISEDQNKNSQGPNRPFHDRSGGPPGKKPWSKKFHDQKMNSSNARDNNDRERPRNNRFGFAKFKKERSETGKRKTFGKFMNKQRQEHKNKRFAAIFKST